MTQFTHAQNARLAKCLDTLEKQLRDDIRAALLQTGDEHHAELAGTVHDLGDESVADLLAGLESEMHMRHLQELQDIQAARRRLSNGDIDHCSDCGGEIGYKRLMAYPVAVRCVACQDHHEKTYAHEASPRM